MFDVLGKQMAELLNLGLPVALVLDDSAWPATSDPVRLRACALPRQREYVAQIA